MSKHRRQLGENVPRGSAEALGLAVAQRNLVTPPCPGCDRLMFATAELRSIEASSADTTAGGAVPLWFCGNCKLSHPVADEDRPRWKAARRVQREASDA